MTYGTHKKDICEAMKSQKCLFPGFDRSVPIWVVAVQTGAAIALVHHFAKGNATRKRAQDRLSGNGVFARDPDYRSDEPRRRLDSAH